MNADRQKADRRAALLAALWVLLTLAWFVQGGSWSPNARLALTRALVEKGTLDCRAYAHASGDLVEAGGRLIPYKAPGLSFLAAPPWALLRALGPAGPAASPRELTRAAYLANLLVTGLPLAWAAAWLVRLCLFLRPGAYMAAAWTVAAAFAGTLLLPTGTLFLAHATAAALCFAAFARALLAPPRSLPGGLGLGLLLGLIPAVEYLALPVAAGTALLAAWRGAGRGRLGLCLGALPPLLLLAAYHQALLGAPWRIPYANPPDRFATEGAAGGLFVAPTWHVVWQTTLGPYRGVFFSSPVLLAGLWGLRAAWRRGGPWRAAAALSLAVAAWHFAFLWTFNGWHGGWAVGARYFAPALPFLAWPLALVIDRAGGLPRLLAALSVAFMVAATAINPQVPNGSPEKARPDPWLDYLLPALLAGEVADQVQSVDEKFPRWEFWPRGRALESLARSLREPEIQDPLTGRRRRVDPDRLEPALRRFLAERREREERQWQERFAPFPPEVFNPRHPEAPAGATNLGLLLGLPGLWSLLPLGAVWLLCGLAWRRNEAGASAGQNPSLLSSKMPL